MTIAHHLGLPRIGANRDLKWALERYWKGEITEDELQAECARIRANNWSYQVDAGLDFLSVGDFSLYDHVLDLSCLLNVCPDRFKPGMGEKPIDTYFRMARGRASTGKDTPALEMTKWFDTNYHYIVPELSETQTFKVDPENRLTREIAEAQKLNKKIKPILLGPLSYLWLSKTHNPDFDKLSLLNNLQTAYLTILNQLRAQNIEWIQIDEPILVLDLPLHWQEAFKSTYKKLRVDNLNCLLTTYFASLGNNTKLALELPTQGLHIDAVRGADQLDDVVTHLPKDKILSVGIVDGRNIWRTDLRKALQTLQKIKNQLGDRLWVGSSCSLLHCPVDLQMETKMDPEIKSWLAFAKQKLQEIAFLSNALDQDDKEIQAELTINDKIILAKTQSNRIHNPEVKKRSQNITEAMLSRQNPYASRKIIQNAALNLPLFPTTTIGSFPQTTHIRSLRQQLKSGEITDAEYQTGIKKEIAFAIEEQLKLGLDVLVHGEAERNDMVEYFGEQLQGFTFTQNGWVQSYGSRCVKPPIIYGDVSRKKAMTVDWITYAQSLTDKPVKGMLTGPITILCWSFVRNDQSRYETAKQIALSLCDEVTDLVNAGIKVIQIDEPAFREGLPLQKSAWEEYLQHAVQAFRLASSSVPDHIQIHTHMCYSEFNDIIDAIAHLDADVITIETSRSAMELLKAFETFNYPNDIGPGVYDIHSPRIPTVDEIIELMIKAARLIEVQQLWINPDCGLKTRDWKETQLALQNMVKAAHVLREKITENKTEKTLFKTT